MDPSNGTAKFQSNRLLKAKIATLSKSLMQCRDSIDNELGESQSSLAERIFWLRTKRLLTKVIDEILEDIP